MNSLFRLAAALVIAPALAIPAAAQRYPVGGRPADSGVRLLALPEVQKELRLEPRQLEQIAAARTEMNRQITSRVRTLKDLPPVKRRAEFDALREEGDRKQLGLLNQGQQKRLRELALQQEGARALMRADVTSSLKLTAEQLQKVKQALEEETTGIRSAFKSGTGVVSRDEARKKYEGVRKVTDAKLLSVLTDAQRRSFKEMQGAPFTFPRPGARAAAGRS